MDPVTETYIIPTYDVAAVLFSIQNKDQNNVLAVNTTQIFKETEKGKKMMKLFVLFVELPNILTVHTQDSIGSVCIYIEREG